MMFAMSLFRSYLCSISSMTPSHDPAM